jgi:hypothetical protein
VVHLPFRYLGARLEKAADIGSARELANFDTALWRLLALAAKAPIP